MNSPPRRIPVLTVQRPWAALLFWGDDGKPIDNRSWSTRYRGPMLIHAGRVWDRTALAIAGQVAELPGFDWHEAAHPVGIIGVVDLVDVCIRDHTTNRRKGVPASCCGPWSWRGFNHWHREDPEPFRAPIPAAGKQGLWYPDGPVAESVALELARIEEVYA